MRLSFIAIHSLPLSKTPQVMKFPQEFGGDTKVLQDTARERTTASCKLKNRLASDWS